MGCEKCHGGDPTVYDAFRAHQGILGSRNPSRPVNRVNLPRTCGQVRQSLDRARELLHRVKDKKRRAQLEAAYTQAEVPLTEAANAGHAFVFTALRERLETARRRSAVLLEDLANPPAPR